MKQKRSSKLLAIVLTGLILAPSFISADSNIPQFMKIQKDTAVGMASWYSETDPGINKHTANMEVFDDSQMTAAMWDVPFDQLVKVTNLRNGKSVIVRINDRGPHRRFVRQGRLIDLTKGAFSQIAPLGRGLIDIQLEIL